MAIANLQSNERGKRLLQCTITEEQVQQNIRNALTLYGYTVLSTSEHRKRERCRKCGEWATSSAGRGIVS